MDRPETKTPAGDYDGFAYVTYPCTIPLDFDRVPEHWHDQMEVIYVKGGRGVVSLDFERHEVTANTIVVVRPGRVHAIEGLRGERMEYENIIFSLEAFDSRMPDDWCRDNVLTPLREGTLSFESVLSPGSELHDEVARALDAADAASAEGGPGYTLAVKSSIYLFFQALYRHATHVQAPAPDAVAERLKPVLREVKTHFDKPISVEEAAGLAGSASPRRRQCCAAPRTPSRAWPRTAASTTFPTSRAASRPPMGSRRQATAGPGPSAQAHPPAKTRAERKDPATRQRRGAKSQSIDAPAPTP